MDQKPDMKYTLLYFRRQTGKDKEIVISVGWGFAWLAAAVPPMIWHLFGR